MSSETLRSLDCGEGLECDFIQLNYLSSWVGWFERCWGLSRKNNEEIGGSAVLPSFYVLKVLGFLLVQLRRPEARDLSHAIQKGKVRLCGCPVLCLSPLNELLPLFFCPAPGLRGTCHKPKPAKKAKNASPSCFVLCHQPLSKALPLFYMSSSGGLLTSEN
jgi:hypothetical protein